MNLRFADIRKHPSGIELAWQLLMERPPEANISHREMPTLEEHAKYVTTQPYRVWLVVESDVIHGEEYPFRELIGTIALTKQNEIGVGILKAHQRMGYARDAIRLVMSLYPPLTGEIGVRPGCYVAHVAPLNWASHNLFNKLGAKIIQATYSFGD